MTHTAKDMLSMLRRHYVHDEKRPSGVFASEIQSPGGQRRADLIWQGCTAASGNELVGHEIKTSKADLAAELADLTKSDPWQRYCDRWWLVVNSPDLVTGYTIPHTWGVMAPPSGRRTRSMTIVKAAPALTPDHQAPGLRAIVGWLHWRNQDALAEQQRIQAESARLHDLVTELRRKQAAPVGDHSELGEVIEQIIRRLGGLNRDGCIGRGSNEVYVDDLVNALNNLGTVYERAEVVEMRVGGAIQRLRHVLRSVEEIGLDEVQAAVRDVALGASRTFDRERAPR